MTTTAKPTAPVSDETPCPNWCVVHNDLTTDEFPERIEHQSEALRWSRKRGYVVQLLKIEGLRTELHITDGQRSIDALVNADDLLDLMRCLAKTIEQMHADR